MIKQILTRFRIFPLLTCCLYGFSVSFTIFNRFANTYFWTISGKAQLFLLLSLSALLTILLYFLTLHLLSKFLIRSITRRFVFIALMLSLMWVFLPFVENLYKGEIRTPEHLLIRKHQLKIIATGYNNPLSKGSEVRIKHIEIRDLEGKGIIFNPVDKSGTWIDQNQELVTTNNYPASVSYDFQAMKEESQLMILFAVSPYSGKVTIVLDGKEKSVDLFEAQHGETLLTIPIPTNSMGLIWTLFLRLLEAISITTIFYISDKKTRFYVVFILFSIFLLFTIYRAPPERYGDGYEYLSMTQAFQNHQSPNLTEPDISSLYAPLSKNLIPIPSMPYSGFFESKSGMKFSYHFWFYSLIIVPSKIVLERLGLNGLLAFQLTNTLLFLISLWGFLLWGNLEDYRKMLLIAFLATNPVLWYLTWWHPEVFTYSLVILSLIFLTNKKHKLAILFAAIASMQNPPLMFLAGYFILIDMGQYWPKISVINLIKTALYAIPAFIPAIFYYIFYRTPSLILSSGPGMEHITSQKFFGFFLDLNIGILPYMPILLLFLIFVFIKCLWERRYLDTFFGFTIFIIVLSTAQNDNWNNDSAGLIRYAVWVTPLMAFYVVRNMKWVGFWRGVWMGGIVYQLFMFMFFGGINAKINYVQMTPIAQVVLDHFPQLYSPEKEIFMERANHMERTAGKDFKFSFYASKDGNIKKILTDYEHFEKFRTLQNTAFQVTDNNALDNAELFLANKDGLHYLDFPNGEIRITNFEKLSKTFID